jgi:hypothetical protein
MMRSGSYETWAAAFIGPLLFLISLPWLKRVAKREDDHTLYRFLMVALAAKLLGAVVRYWVAFHLYGGLADSAMYHDYGATIAQHFRAGDFHTGLSSLTGTNFMRFFTGVVFTITGTTMLGGFLFFSWLSFWGMVLAYRAFSIAVPDGRRRSYARLLFFLPTMVFWPSSIGKEAWMVFALGIAAYGAALTLTRSAFRGVVIAGAGLWLAAFVRPPVAGMIALAMVGAAIIRRPRRELQTLGPIVKVFTLVVLAVMSIFLLKSTDRFLRTNGIETNGGLGAVSQQLGERTGEGGSEFSPNPILKNPSTAPAGIATVLFRPFLTEAHSGEGLASALEGTFLMGLTLVRIRWIWSAVKSMRRHAYLAYAGICAALLIVALSSYANFGILARERAQVYLFYLALLAVPPLRKREEPDAITVTPRALELTRS